ncbi:MFS transporter [Agromyces sp. SYSU T00194]|uniref:MFS transporter n=1 Tax=Agromyces chitinivorans TaxID=3158560 RepID=UPI003392E635
MTSTRRWLGLVVIGIAVSLIIVDTTVVNVAIPAIVDDLGISSTQVQWVQESYALVFAALLIAFGTLGDRIGRRRLLLIGVAIFTAASVAAGLAPDGATLIAARVAQGVGGAMVLPGTMSLINTGFRGRDRTIAFAVWGSIIGGMAALGPLLGGWLITDFSWRWAFGVNVPFGLFVLAAAVFTIPESKSEHPERFDPVGALLGVVAAGVLVFSLIEGRTLGWLTVNERVTIGGWSWPWDLSPTPVLIGVAVLALVGFLIWERARERRGAPTLFPLQLFSLQTFRNGNLVALIVSLGELGLLFVLPIWMQNVLGYTPLQAGFALVALAVGSFLATGMVSGLARRMTPVGMLRLGVALELVGVLVLGILLATDTGWPVIAGLLFVYGLGIGLASSQVTNVVLVDVPVDRSGQASGTQSTARQIGSALGVAVLGTVLFGTLGTDLEQRLGDLPDAQREQVVDIVTGSAGAAIPALRADASTADAGDLAAESLTAASSYAAYTAAGFLAIALAASATLRPRRDDADADAAVEQPANTTEPATET